MDETRRRTSHIFFWLVTAMLFVIAVALRWVRLDLMMFRYDQAEVAFRAMETFRVGFPFTGIVNSLGFRNAGGYVWTVLPPFLITPDPKIATAWHGLLASTAVVPLALLGRRYRRDGLMYLPGVIAAVIPVSVFAGRNLWAQHLLPALAAWGIYLLDRALRTDLSAKQQRWAAGWCLGVLAWATSVHFSAGPLLLVAVLFLVVQFRSQLKSLLVPAVPALIIFVSMIPSAVSYWQQKTNPTPKPDFAQVYEAMLPPPFPWWMRLQEAVEFTFWNASVDTAPGIARLLREDVPIWLTISYGLDIAVTAMAVGGAVAGLVMVFRRRRGGVAVEGEEQKRLPQVLLAWLLVPLLLGGLLVQRINAGYFLGATAAVWALPLCLQLARGWWGRMVGVVPALFLGAGLCVSGMFLVLIARHGIVPGNYYVPYGEQVKVVEYLERSDVKPGRLIHLSGGWYQHSYDYIHRYMGAGEVEPRGGFVAQPFGVMEDKNLRLDEPRRIEFFWGHEPREFLDVGVIVFPARGPAELFVEQYYQVPER